MTRLFPFSFTDAGIPGLKLITPFASEDARGCFVKPFEKNAYKENGILFEVSEHFETESKQYVLRGLHLQTCEPQAKLVRVIRGAVWDVAVDLRENSPNYLKWHGVTLSGENRVIFYIPPGFAHGFFTLSESALVSYLCSGAYDRESDGGVVWNDPAINVGWPIPEGAAPILSERDKGLPLARDARIAEGTNV
jgi:dTDP-4-dehydrorhamnose 3,5-epimerase